MIGHHDASSALTLLVLLAGASVLQLSSSIPIDSPSDVDNLYSNARPGLLPSGDEQSKDDERRSLQKEGGDVEEELFKDIDPKTLAAVLLEALNHSQVERRREEEEHDGREEEAKAEADRDARTMEGAERHRDGREELELLMAAQGREQARVEEEERKKAQEEEERMTERVTSHTTSQTVQVKPEEKTVSPNEQDATASQQGENNNEEGEEEEEEQLNPEELKSLETMMKEFPRLGAATKRDGERESRGYSSYNEVIPANKASDGSLFKKKLKWQEETQKALSFPMFKGNFMTEFEDNNAVDSGLRGDQEVMEEDEPKEEEDDDEEEDEEVLNPEEEEAQAKAEQEEMRRQAAEAQRAKMEEEKLADIASDMLLRYMVKENNGNRKHGSSLSNAMEDKRSDEVQEAMEEDDIDPQTIDKLIEISSKLHLPADDVVDIISDVEKKKKKDVVPESASRWQRPLSLSSPSSSFYSSNNVFPVSQNSANQNSFPISKQPSPSSNLLKTTFPEKSQTKSQEFWSRLSKPMLSNQNLWSRPQKPQKELWLKSPKSSWPAYPYYSYAYPSYQRRPYLDYRPFYLPPPPRPRPRFYLPKPVFNNNLRGNSADDPYAFPSKHRYQSWVQPQLRKPPIGLQQKPYYSSFPLPLYPRTFHPVPIPRRPSPARVPIISPQTRRFYYPLPAAPTPMKNNDYYVSGKKSDGSSRDSLEKYIQQILTKRPQTVD